MKRSTPVIAGLLVLMLTLFGLALAQSTPPADPPPVSEEQAPPAKDPGDEGFAVRCCSG
ncbi:MAG: hypothetical protein SFU83_05880 [Meiothermus sp.]|nr:hypothetical protein [Meiothermus sp.]